MLHYAASPQERSQLNGGRWFGVSGPLCNTGDGSWVGVHPDDWVGTPPPITCPKCIALKHTLSPRDRDRIGWDENSTVRIVRI